MRRLRHYLPHHNVNNNAILLFITHRLWRFSLYPICSSKKKRDNLTNKWHKVFLSNQLISIPWSSLWMLEYLTIDYSYDFTRLVRKTSYSGDRDPSTRKLQHPLYWEVFNGASLSLAPVLSFASDWVLSPRLRFTPSNPMLERNRRQ